MKLGSAFQKVNFLRDASLILKVLAERIFQELIWLNLMNFKNQRLKMTLKMILKSFNWNQKTSKSSKGSIFSL